MASVDYELFCKKRCEGRGLLFTFKQSRADHAIIYLLQTYSTEAGAAPGILGAVFCGTILTNLPRHRSLGADRPPTVYGCFSDAVDYLPVYLLAVYSALYLMFPLISQENGNFLARLLCAFFHLAVRSRGYYITKVIFIRMAT
jgi:hypothetical protein